MKNSIQVSMAILGIIALNASCKSTTEISNEKQNNRGPQSIEQLFETMDTNKDGQLAKNEVRGPLKNDFSKIDMDHDGMITKEELNKAPKPNGQRPSKRRQ